jgi:hypothetical protein
VLIHVPVGFMEVQSVICVVHTAVLIEDILKLMM